MKFFRIKNWKDFQHYKDRNPAWIKLHKSLLDNYDYQCLPLASKALAPMLWLLASEYSDPSAGLIEYNYRKMAFRLRCTEEEIEQAIKPLIDNEFIELYQDDSEPIAQPEQDDSPEKRRGYREETEEEERRRARDPEIEMAFETCYRAYPGFNKGKISDGQKGSRQDAMESWRKIFNGKKENEISALAERVTQSATDYGAFLKKTNGISKSMSNWLDAKGWETDYGVKNDIRGSPAYKMPSPAGG